MILVLPLVRILIFLIWLVDVATNFDVVKLSKRIGKTVTFVLALSFAGFLAFSYYSGYLNKVFTGYFSSRFYPDTMLSSIPRQYPILAQKILIPQVTAKSFFIMDRGNSKVLYEYNSDLRLAPASTTKLMTALVALDIYDLNEIVEVPEFCTTIDSTKIWLPQGFKFKVRDLVYSMLIGSAGDSACVLASGKVPYDKFVNLMNRKAFLIGLGSTHFSNPIGLDGLDGENYSTSKDLYTLSQKVMDNGILSEIVKTKEYTFVDANNSYSTRVVSTNQLLWDIPNTVGVKTGTTQSAGEVLIYAYLDSQKRLNIVVMGSQDRFSDTKKLLNWALNSYSWE